MTDEATGEFAQILWAIGIKRSHEAGNKHPVLETNQAVRILQVAQERQQ